MKTQDTIGIVLLIAWVGFCLFLSFWFAIGKDKNEPKDHSEPEEQYDFTDVDHDGWNMKRKFQYRVALPLLPPNAKYPIIGCKELEWWLNEMDKEGWELVTHGHKIIKEFEQHYCVFRKSIR